MTDVDDTPGPKYMDAAALYERFRKRELNWLQKRVCMPQDAEDILQTAFMKVCKHFAADGDPIKQPSSWIRTITYHTLIDYWRMNGNRPSQCSLDDEDEFFGDLTVFIDENFAPGIIHQHGLVESLRRVINEADVPDRERQLLQLWLAGFDYEEIAVEMDLASASAARGLFFRLKHSLNGQATVMPSFYYAELALVTAHG